jgi:hypothetical protein
MNHLPTPSSRYGVLLLDDTMEPALPRGCLAMVWPDKPLKEGRPVHIEFQDGTSMFCVFVRQRADAVTVHKYKPTTQEFEVSRIEIASIDYVAGWFEPTEANIEEALERADGETRRRIEEVLEARRDEEAAALAEWEAP